MGSQYVVNGSEEITGMGYLQDGATIPAGNALTNNGTETTAGLATFNGGVTVALGQTLTNNGSYAGTPIVTSITVGPGLTIVNPTSPGTALISALSSITNNLADYSTTSLNFSLSTNYNITALNLIK